MINALLEHNRKWAADKQSADPDYFQRLASLQRPDYLWIGCSDSRVPANVITGLEPGEVFVHRNVANLIHPSDMNMLSVVEYAIEVLEVKHIILCGHYGCGGVHAAMDGCRHGLVDHWLQPVRDTAEAQADELDKIDDHEQKMNRLCELSIEAQVRQLAKTPILQNAWEQGKEISIHPWVYGLEDGRIRDLDGTVVADR
ncbi:carbonic anhydrase [Granulosicoccus sp.]|nr:carbonic anhydrase [Granulosicoccus sp.]MDB4224418.1 carbonic anhydrase [Granulosicoccus sp.]